MSIPHDARTSSVAAAANVSKPTAQKEDGLMQQERASWEAFRSRYATDLGVTPDALARMPWTAKKPGDWRDGPNETELSEAFFQWVQHRIREQGELDEKVRESQYTIERELGL